MGEKEEENRGYQKKKGKQIRTRFLDHSFPKEMAESGCAGSGPGVSQQPGLATAS